MPIIALYSRSRHDLMEMTGASKQDCDAMRRITRKTIEEFAEEHRGQLQEIAEKLAKQAIDSVDSLRPMEKMIALGIVTDKLNAAPKTLNQALHLHIKGDAAGALKAILGPAAQSVFGQADAKATKRPVIELPAEHVIPSGPSALDAVAEDDKSTGR